MTWEKFLELNAIGKKYHRAAINDLMTPVSQKFGMNWGANPMESIVLTGETGRGKTYYMYALIREILNKYPIAYVRFFKSKNLDDRILEEFNRFGSSSYFIKGIIEVPVLCLDDFGVERPTERMGRDMYEIIDGRLEWERPTVLSTNLSDSDIEDVYGKRILSRLKEYAWINFEGEDRRGKI